MKLNLIKEEIPKKKLNAYIDGDVMADVELYAELIKAKTGRDAPLGKLVEGVLREFMKSDKDFQREKAEWLARKEKGSEQDVTPQGEVEGAGATWSGQGN